MKCPKCLSEKSSVVDSRGDVSAIRRRRECTSCGFRFTTFERIEAFLPMIVKKDGSRQPFDRAKVKTGILRACVKRPVAAETIDQTVQRIERHLHEMRQKEIDAQVLGDLIIKALQDIDEIAYVRFASVYREFSDLNQFVETLRQLSETSEK